MARKPRPDLDDEIELDEAPDPPSAREQEDPDAMFLRAKAWAAEQRLLRVEVDAPSGGLVTYRDPALYLEAFAAEELARAARRKRR